MNRLPWAPLNAGVFLIIFGGLILLSFFNIGVNLFTVFPLIFTVFGIWLVIEAFVIPPTNAYAPPRTMVVGWGALIAGLGLLWFVGATAAELLPVAFALLLVILGIGAVAYSFMRASPKSPTTPTS
jgi:uncharacterized membrane protein HdeD (DUF308 family)